MASRLQPESRGSGERRYVLLDRDGTLNVECHHLSDPDQVRLLPTVLDGLQLLQRCGVGLVVVTNQSVIGRGMVSWAGLGAIHARLAELLHDGDVVLDGIYACPHTPTRDCACRKPRAGLVQRAAQVHGFDPRHAVVIGDSESDIKLGHNVGATSILVMTGHGRSAREQGDVRPDFVAADFFAAARLAVEQLGGSKPSSRSAGDARPTLSTRTLPDKT